MNQTIIQKIRELDDELFHDLNEWEQGFIRELAEGTESLSAYMPDDDVNEYLTRRQINKVEEIWKNLK